MRRERDVTLSIHAWLQHAGPRQVCEWLALTAEDLAVDDLPSWRFWAVIADCFRDVAKAMPQLDDLNQTHCEMMVDAGGCAPAVRVIKGGRAQ